MDNSGIYDNIFKTIDANTVVLTPNRRLSATLHKHYQLFQQKKLSACWQTPAILPLSSWIQQVWHNQVSHEKSLPFLLNSAQEQYIWEQILHSTSEDEHLLQVSETAETIRAAWILLKQWQINIDHADFNNTDDSLALKKWVGLFQQKCKDNNWIDSASLPDVLITNINAKKIKTPKQIYLLGFTEQSPQLSRLLIACAQQGSNVSIPTLPSINVSCARISLPKHDDEVLAMAKHAKATLTKNPDATIACVIPTLDQSRSRVLQLFSEVFAESNTYTIDPKTSPFNLSAGKKLAKYPIIHSALKLLSLGKKSIPATLLNFTLSTPFIGEADREYNKRAHFENMLRKKNVTTINFSVLMNEEGNNSFSFSKQCPLLHKRLKNFLEFNEANQTERSFSEWAEIFNESLNMLGWPGERSLNSEEYQVVDSWLTLLVDFATLDIIAKPVSLIQALKALYRLVNTVTFQPKSPDAPIQVLGVLEAASLPFDYLWVAGMDDVTWPPQPQPNPFIPKRLQREFQMPHATAERELNFCKTLILQFQNSSRHLIFSHTEKQDELELQPSPLIRHIKEINENYLGLHDYQPPSIRIFQSRKINIVLDETAPHIQANEPIRGGVSVIKHQALCPFKAFSEWRLHAHELQSPQPGLRAQDRGTILHKALEVLWSNIHDHSTLLHLADAQLSELINQSINIAINSATHSHFELKQYLALEHKRLHKIIWEWLEIEKKRDPFKVITHEQSIQVKLGNLPLQIRIDRIDELENGKQLIIDYKTGKNNEISSWFSSRPEEPQLPLYALLEPEQTLGITFAQISPGDYGFKGVSSYDLEIDGIKLISEIKQTTALSWQEQIKQWQQVLRQLSDDFYHGIATVDPKDPPQTCTWCALKPLCRINEEIEQAHDN